MILLFYHHSLSLFLEWEKSFFIYLFIYLVLAHFIDHFSWLSGKESVCQHGRCEFDLWVRKIPWRRKWPPTPVFLPGKSHGQRSPMGYRPWGLRESGTTRWLSTHPRTHTHCWLLTADCCLSVSTKAIHFPITWLKNPTLRLIPPELCTCSHQRAGTKILIM